MPQHIYTAQQLKYFLDLLATKHDLNDVALVFRSSDPESDSLFGPYYVKYQELEVVGGNKELEQQVVIELGGI